MLVDEYDIVETLFRKQTFAEYYMTLNNLADGLEACELYNANRPEHVPPGGRYREHVAVMKELGVGADRGDALLKDQRQTVRNNSELDMHSTVSYMKTIAIHKRDPTVMLGWGLPAKDQHTRSSRRSSALQTAAIHVTVQNLKGSPRTIVIKATHVRGGGPYLVNLCKGDPSIEANWYNPAGSGSYKNCSKIVIGNLESVTKYFVRMRTDEPGNPGEWSQPVSIVVP